MDGAAAALDAQELAQLAHVVADVWPSNDEAAQDQLLAEQEGVDGDEDAAYFAQYASLALHRELLADRARNRAYAECLAQVHADRRGWAGRASESLHVHACSCRWQASWCSRSARGPGC